MRISKKDFIQYPNRYIQEGSFILTLYGKDEYEVTIKKVTNKVTTIDKVTNNTPQKVTITPKVTNTPDMVTNIHQRKVTTSPSKAERIDTAKSIGLKTANDIPAPKEVTKAYPGIKTQADYESHQARQKEKENRISHHGCGCKKTESRLCTTHNRI